MAALQSYLKNVSHVLGDTVEYLYKLKPICHAANRRDKAKAICQIIDYLKVTNDEVRAIGELPSYEYLITHNLPLD